MKTGSIELERPQPDGQRPFASKFDSSFQAGFLLSWWHLMFSWFRRKSDSTPLRGRVGVRLEAIGGQGANSAGKILAEAAVLGCGYAGNHFSSFGSEKRGSPVRSFVRFTADGTPVRSASFIARPDLLVVFHEFLLSSHSEILEGVHAGTTLVLNTARVPSQIAFPNEVRLGRVLTIDATEIARKRGCGLNAVMLGASSLALPEVPEEKLREALENFFSRLPEKLRKANLAGFTSGRSEAVQTSFHPDQARLNAAAPPLPPLGYLNAPIGGLIQNPGNTVLKDNSASRKGVAPRFLSDTCFHCGYCDLVCPDYCFVWAKNAEGKPELQGIDYRFCKGCQKCVVACPVQALVPILEGEIPESERELRLFPEASSEVVEGRWKNADWAKITSEMTAETKMLTLQTELLDTASYLRPSFPERKEI